MTYSRVYATQLQYGICHCFVLLLLLLFLCLIPVFPGRKFIAVLRIAVLETHGKIAEAGEIFCVNLYIVQYHLGKNGRNGEIMLGQI